MVVIIHCSYNNYLCTTDQQLHSVDNNYIVELYITILVCMQHNRNMAIIILGNTQIEMLTPVCTSEFYNKSKARQYKPYCLTE